MLLVLVAAFVHRGMKTAMRQFSERGIQVTFEYKENSCCDRNRLLSRVQYLAEALSSAYTLTLKVV